jgi:hypothetical protein
MFYFAGKNPFLKACGVRDRGPMGYPQPCPLVWAAQPISSYLHPPLDLSSVLFHSAFKTLLFNRCHPDTESNLLAVA